MIDAGTIMLLARGASLFVPQIAVALPFLEKAMPLIVAGAPYVGAAVEKGARVVDAISESVPDLIPLIRDVARERFGADDDDAQELVAAFLFGRKWTPEEEQRWVDSQTPNMNA